MHLSVVHEHPDITGIRTGKRTFRHLLHDTLEDGRHEAGIDGTADYAVVELKLAAPFQVIGFLALDIESDILSVNLELVRERNAFHDRAYQQVDFTELAGST